jgi:phosphoribosylaminoimidazole carboxylase
MVPQISIYMRLRHRDRVWGSHKQPLVELVMGSDSNLPVMLRAARILDRFEIPYKLAIVSAHHMPDRLVEYARS